jgi:ParB family transcriptional regulator, chromosome partitioning protein
MTKRSGLGRGLEALIPANENQAAGPGPLEIPIHSIQPNPFQPRTHLDPESLADLILSIREHGIIQPLLVRPDPSGAGYILIAGERRWRAAQSAGLQMVPVVVRDADERTQLELALIENIQRADLSPLETAEAYRQLVEDFKLSHEEVAHRVGKSRTAVTNTLRLLKLPQTVLDALAEGKISEGHARALLALNTTASQSAALNTILIKELNVRQTEELARKLNGQRAAVSKPRAPISAEIESLEERLRGQLGTKVNLHYGPKGGTLVIHYFSDEELNSIVTQILKE